MYKYTMDSVARTYAYGKQALAAFLGFPENGKALFVIYSLMALDLDLSR